jgi:AcrR family transcriptional regulator
VDTVNMAPYHDLVSPQAATPTGAAIIAAAGALLESGGPEAVTLRSVGAVAGVSRSAPYRHFADKADLMRALATETLTELATRIRRAAGEPGGQRSRLHRGCAGYLSYAIEQPHHYLLIFGDAPPGEPDQEVEAAADDGMLALRELVEGAQAEGELGAGPPRELATIVWVLLHGLAQLRITGHLHEPRTVEGDAGVDELLALALAALRPAAG